MSGVDWIIAVTAPETIAPHPNFSIDTVQPVELLALLADARLEEYTRHRESSLDSSVVDPLDGAVVDGIWDSLVAEHQDDGIRALRRIIGNMPGSPTGREAAACLFLCVALGEHDRSAEAVSFLDGLLLRMPQRGAITDSFRIVEAALRQQRVLRLVECGRRDEAFEEADAVERVLPKSSARFESFAVSKGSVWTARQAQREVGKTLRNHARSSKAALESLGGRRWIDVVKTQPSAIDARLNGKQAQAGRAFVQEHFERRYSWTRNRRRFMSGDPVEGPAYTALLRTELLGDLSSLRRRRELLGHLRVLRGLGAPEDETTDAIRLFRQSDAREPLEDLLRWVRADGPASALVEGARSVLAKKSISTRPTRCDLIVLTGASEVMTASQLKRSLTAASAFRGSPSNHIGSEVLAEWAIDDIVWRWTASLLPGSGRDAYVARQALSAIQNTTPADPVSDALESVVEAIEWDEVPVELRTAWVKWARGQDDVALFGLVSTILDRLTGVRRHDDGPPRPGGLELAARLVWEHGHGVQPEQAELSEAASNCAARLRAIRESAARGSYGFGGINSSDVAVLLASRLGKKELWPLLFDLLLDPAVSLYDKAPALERMAVDRPDLPPSLLERIKSSPERLFTGANVGPFGGQQLALSGAVLRFVSAYELAPRGDWLVGITQLAGSDRADGRVEAARCAEVVAGSDGTPEWAGVLLLQLSHDNDPVVRAEAGRSLASRWDILGATAPAAEQRIAELLHEQGILVPLLTLRGLTRANTVPRKVNPLVLDLAATHPARVVRTVAQAVAADLGNS